MIRFQSKLIMRNAFLIASFCILSTASAMQAQLKPDSCNEYLGTMGKETEIGMSLSAVKDSLEGSYFCKKQLQDIRLTGRFTAVRDISLIEEDSAAQTRGTFFLHFAEQDAHCDTSEPLRFEVLQGKWVSEDGKTSYPVYLRLEHDCPPAGQNRYAVAGARNDELVEKNVQAFYGAILAGNREVAAKYVSYPATFFEQGKQRSMGNSAEFLKNYDQLLTSAYVAKIAAGTPHHMFANWQGIMIADGALWFDAEGKAKHFNNELRTR